MENIFYIIHILISVLIILFILLQKGKGTETGMIIGDSSSKDLFGVYGSNKFLIKSTIFLCILFVLSILNLNYMTFKFENLKIIDKNYNIKIIDDNFNFSELNNNNLDLSKIPD